jgi:hypothetical protein
MPIRRIGSKVIDDAISSVSHNAGVGAGGVEGIGVEGKLNDDENDC